MIKKVKLGDNFVSELGFGAMRFPTGADGLIDYPASQELIDRCMEAGINYFDTGWFYHKGESEVCLRKTLVERYPRDSFYLADKLVYGECSDPEFADKERFKVQMDRLGVEYIDYYLQHGLGEWGWKHCKDTGIDKYLFGLKDKGLIKHAAFSFHDRAEALEIILEESAEMWTFAQLQLNYFDWKEINSEKMYEIAEKYNMPVVVMEPVRGGSLANMHPNIMDTFKKAAPDLSVASWAMRFCGSLPNVKVVLSGMTTMEQLEDNIKTFSDFKPLSDNERKVIDEIREIKLPTAGCTKCDYCAGVCPENVNIPVAFAAYDNYIMFDNPWHVKWYYDNKPAENRADKCSSCGACVPKCPQGLDIPELLKKVCDVVNLC